MTRGMKVSSVLACAIGALLTSLLGACAADFEVADEGSEMSSLSAMAEQGATQVADPEAKPTEDGETAAPDRFFTLNTTDLALLQAQVDEQLKNSVGGKQIAPNVVEYDGGETIAILPLPGERQARRIGEPIEPQGTPNCAFQNACLYSGTNFDGTRLQRFACGEIDLRNVNFANVTSSIHNNQTNNTQTFILNSSRQILNANRALSKVNDVGVGGADRAIFWRVC